MNRRALWLELLLLAGLIGLALVFRLPGLTAVPDGLHHDEAIDLRQGLLILDGARFLYTSEGWGREALFYYPFALMLRLVADNVAALRATVVLFSTGVIGVSYLLARRLAGRLAAWLTAAWLAVNYWALFTSRFGVRHISLPFMLGLAALAFWWAWEEERPRARIGRYAVAGFLLGLTLYTYQPARFVPVLFVAFAGYLLLFRRADWRVHWRGLAVFGAVAALVVLPLALALAGDTIETSSRAWTIEPLTALLAGDLGPAFENVLAAAGMFTIAGDPLVAYNVPGRPVFQPAWTGLFFYAGLALALWRWRRPRYAFLLIWLAVMLLPTVVTIDAPNFNRAIGAQFPVFFLSALPAAEAARRLADRRRVALIPVGLALLALGLTAVVTWRDYFTVWPAEPDLALLYHPHDTDIARYLDASQDGRPAIISSRDFENIDPLIVRVAMDGDAETRWVDSSQALAWPAGADDARLLLAADRWVDETLSTAVGLPSQPEIEAARFAVYRLPSPDWPASGLPSLQYLPADAPWPADPSTAPPLPAGASFAGQVRLAGLDLPEEVEAGGTVTAVTRWQILADGQPVPLSFFVHLLDGDGQLVAQHDGLGYPPHTWRAGDRFIQVHRLPLDPSPPPGEYWLQLGLYRRDTGQRWPLVASDGAPLGDRLLVGAVTIR